MTRQPQKKKEEDTRCPLSFRLGSTHSAHFGSHSTATTSSSSTNDASSDSTTSTKNTGVGTHTPPIIYPLHPDFDAGSGRQILLTTDYEVMEMWTPSSAIGADIQPGSSKSSSDSTSTGGVEGQSTEQLKEDEQFPLLFESSSFYHSSPIVADVEGDGIADAILGDYDGTLHMVGLDFEHADPKLGGNQRRKRYYRRVVIPRLFVRKSWFEVAINRTNEDQQMANTTASENHTQWEDFEPYHTYFAGPSTDEGWRGKKDEEALRGVSANVLNMDVDAAKGLAQRRKAKTMPNSNEEDKTQTEEAEGEKESEHIEENENLDEDNGDESVHRRLQEVVNEDVHDEGDANEGIVSSDAEPNEAEQQYLDDYMMEDPGLFDDAMGAPPDGTEGGEFDETGNWGDDYNPNGGPLEGEIGEDGDTEGNEVGMTDDFAYHGGGMGDDYYGRYGYGDDYRREAPEGWDSYEQYQEAQDKYYHDSNYLRLPPHLLSDCSLAELPRAYMHTAQKPEDRVDDYVFCAVSYYFDEDECKDPSKGLGKGKSFGRHANADGGDETEELRGRYVANAIMGYNLR